MAYATALSTLSHSLPSPKANATRLLVLRSASDYTYPPAHTELRSWFFGDVGGNGARTLGPSPHPQPSPSPITLTPHPSPLTLTDHRSPSPSHLTLTSHPSHLTLTTQSSPYHPHPHPHPDILTITHALGLSAHMHTLRRSHVHTCIHQTHTHPCMHSTHMHLRSPTPSARPRRSRHSLL